MPWSMTRPKRKDWSEFSTFRKKKNLTSLLHEVSLKDVTPPLDETPPSDRSYGEGERNFGDKSLAFSTAGSVFGGAGDVSRHETDFVEEDNLQENVNILNNILSHSKQFQFCIIFNIFTLNYGRNYEFSTSHERRFQFPTSILFLLQLLTHGLGICN